MNRIAALVMAVALGSVASGCGGDVGSAGATSSATPTPTETVSPTPSATPSVSPSPTASGSPAATPTPLPSQQVECGGPVVYGVDVSDLEGPNIDWAAAKAAGLGFAWMKATQGTTFVATTFAGNWSRSKAAGVRRGAYHFFNPTLDGVAQANAFLAAVGPLDPDDLPPALDIECPDGDPECLGYVGGSGTAPASAIAARAHDFLTTVQAATGRVPVVYTFVSYFSSNGLDTTGLADDTLWIANYGVSCPDIPAPWSAARFWQYDYLGSVTGVSNSVDVDIFFGTPADLALYAESGG